jgi:predicted nucleotidyltransferase
MFTEIDCIKITRAAKKVLGDDTTTEVCGSFSKGTNIYGSDLDFYIDTTYPVTVESRLNLVEELKHTFNESNVGLGRLAIHVNTEVCDIDIVCSNTAEYGIRPRPNEKIHENAPVQYAARCLKEWSKHNIRGKVKGYMLEEMALAVYLSYPVSDQVGSSGLQLFLSVLQTMVDSEEFGTSIYGLRGGSGCTKELRDAAKLTLHQFLMSRPIRGGFQSVAEIALWVCSIRDDDIETSAGKVFSWMALPSVHEMGSMSLCTSMVHRFFSRSRPTTAPRISLDSHALTLLKSSMVGKYLLIGDSSRHQEDSTGDIWCCPA